MDVQLSTKELRKDKPSGLEYHSIPKHPIVVALGGVTNAYNVGSILRLSEALMIESVILLERSGGFSTKKVRKDSIGAEKWIHVEQVVSVSDKCKEFRQQGYQLVGVELCKESIDYRQFKYQSPIVFIGGTEKNGVNPTVLDIVDATIHLPMYGMANSLNFSSSLSVVLYHAISKVDNL